MSVAPDPRISPQDTARFWSKVDRSRGPSACWPWTAGTFQADYGSFWLNGANHNSHCIAWRVTHGAIPDGLFILHKCPGGANRRCVNPAHLYAGTQLQNVWDTVKDGREHHPVGETHPMAKLTEADVRQIRGLRREGLAINQIAKVFAVSPTAIYRIVRGIGWTHVPGGCHAS